MGKSNTYREFMKVLKRHWKTALPTALPLKTPLGSLTMASSFFAGRVLDRSAYVFVQFQPHKNIGGKFTINMILSKDENHPRHYISRDDQPVVGRFTEGPNRIGGFLPAKCGDKWWVLDRDERHEVFLRDYGLRMRNEDHWYPQSWDDPKQNILDAVADVTSSVKIALAQLNDVAAADRAAGA